jgi:hypothetical protein
MAMQVLIGPTIAAGQSLSNILNVSSGGIYRIIMPDKWTEAAPITFQLSYDGVKFYNVYDRNGGEIIMKCIQESVVPIGEYLFYIHSVKIRSGTHREPIVQNEDAVFGVVLETKTAFFEHRDEVDGPVATPTRRDASPTAIRRDEPEHHTDTSSASRDVASRGG